MWKVVRRCLAILLSLIVVALVLLVIFQERLIYICHPYEKGAVENWARQPGATVIDYQTSDGAQQAYLLSPVPNPRCVWIVCGGSGSVSLDWSNWVLDHGPKQDAWLLVDMPGYGACAGSPSPESIGRSMSAVVPAAAGVLHLTPAELKRRLRFFGHSIGCAVCLVAADKNDIHQGVLLTPFTTTMEMSKAVTRVPLGFLVRHRFDNRARLKEIETAGHGRVVILHGTDDETIPITIARDLAANAPDTIRLVEIPGGRHNNLPAVAENEIIKALETAGNAP